VSLAFIIEAGFIYCPIIKGHKYILFSGAAFFDFIEAWMLGRRELILDYPGLPEV
jgi:hypothetical protein